MERDPVCGMLVDRKDTGRRSEHEGRDYYFCSAQCKERFDYDPRLFVERR